ncbi:MAG: hypothetical protein MJ170_00085 [Alphaproteobacteria bacterium]|nr:hypothetical protein [Alphaproteobacteria bacterium]
MKIRNIVFSGFMASILMAGGAYAATADAGSLTTKTYVDTAYNTNAQAITTHASNTDLHVTKAKQDAWDAKQAALNTAQLAAVNSGITSDKVSTYDGYAETIAEKADSADVYTKEETYTQEEVASAIESAIDEISGATGSLTTLAATVEDNTEAIDAEVTRATGVESGLNTRLTAAEADIDALESGKADKTDTYLKAETYSALEVDTALEGKQATIDSTHKLSADYVSGLAAVATSGAYSDLSGKPTNVSTFTNDAGYINKNVADLTNYTTTTDMNTELAKKADSADLGDLAAKNKVEAGDITSGAIVNADISGSAAIEQSKIAGLTAALDAKANAEDLECGEAEGDLCYVGYDGKAVKISIINAFNSGTLDVPSSI